MMRLMMRLIGYKTARHKHLHSLVVPGDDLDEVGLQGEHLCDPCWEVELAAAVPVLAAVDVLELQRGEC